MLHGWVTAHNTVAGDGMSIIVVASMVGIPTRGTAIPAGDKTFSLVRNLFSPTAGEIKVFPFAEWFEQADAAGMTPVPVPGNTVFIYLAYEAVTGGLAVIDAEDLLVES
jgi:hypothetical protein